jgi:hypothetical protein
LKYTLLDHQFGAAGKFFLSRLKYQLDRPSKFILQLIEDSRYSKQRRCMHIMAARMHHTDYFSTGSLVLLFLKSEAHHVCPECNGLLVRIHSFNHGDDTVFAIRCWLVMPNSIQFLLDEFLGFQIPGTKVQDSCEDAGGRNIISARYCFAKYRMWVFKSMMSRTKVIGKATNGSAESVHYSFTVYCLQITAYCPFTNLAIIFSFSVCRELKYMLFENDEQFRSFEKYCFPFPDSNPSSLKTIFRKDQIQLACISYRANLLH